MDGATTLTSVVVALVTAFGTVVGLIVWIVKKLFDVTIPEQQKAFREEAGASRACFEGESQAARELFERKIKGERDFFDLQIRAERDFFGQLLARLVADTQRTHAEILVRLERLSEAVAAAMEAVKENQHGIKEQVRIAEEHFEHWALVAQEWRELNAEGRRKLRAAKQHQGPHPPPQQKPPGPSPAPGGTTQ